MPSRKRFTNAEWRARSRDVVVTCDRCGASGTARVDPRGKFLECSLDTDVQSRNGDYRHRKPADTVALLEVHAARRAAELAQADQDAAASSARPTTAVCGGELRVADLPTRRPVDD